MRDSTIIYRSFYEAIIDLPKENQAEVWAAIFEFSLNFKTVELTGISATIFKLIKPNLEANIKRFENGKKPKQKQKVSETEAKGKQPKGKPKANEDKDEDKDILLKKVSKVFSFFNDKAKSNFKYTTVATNKLVSARLKTYSVEDCEKVISVMVEKWKDDPKMKDYLTPSTLFAESNFEKYLNFANATPSAPAKLEQINADDIFGAR